MSPETKNLILKVTDVCQILNDSVADLQTQITALSEEIVKLKERVSDLENSKPGFHDAYL